MNDPTDSHGGDDVKDPQQFHDEFNAVWGNPRGLRALTIVNHSTIGIRFIITGGIFFLIGGLLAMLMRTQLALPGQRILEPDIYNQMFTMHGTVMMFLFAVPIQEGLAIYLIPKMIGARDLVFPRLSAFGYFCYLFGGIILIFSLILGIAPDTGWFMYTPLTGKTYTPGPNADFWLLGVTFVEISAVAAGVELVVSIMRTRTANMALHHMPLYAWYILVTSLMIVAGFPPLILASILLELERAAGLPFFEIAAGGDPVLWQHLFWLFGHPEVYIIFLPAAGIVSTVLPVLCGRPLVGYRAVVLAVIITGFISFGLWVHHMFTVGIPHLAEAFFSVASMLVAIPTGIQIFAWLATLWTGRPILNVPMLWITGFLITFVAGGLTGVMVALVPFNWQVHDTHFVVAHMHYVLIGGMFFPFMAGLYYWLPHFSGRLYSESLGRWGFWFTFIGFNMVFLLMHLTGLLGMPRRVYTYDTGLGWDWLNLFSSVGAFIMAVGVALVVLDILLHFRLGRPAGPNPWKADTLEWATATPPTPYNFISLPDSPTRHPMWEYPDLQATIAKGQHALPVADHGRRETWGTDPVTGKVREIVHLPGNTWLPFFAALSLAVVCISLLAGYYPMALAAATVTLLLLLRWSWENGTHSQAVPDARALPGDPPLHSHTPDGPGLWGMAVTMLANGSLYLSLLFGWFYLWTVAPQWRVPQQSWLAWPQLLAGGLVLLWVVIWYNRVVGRLRVREDPGLQSHLASVAVLGLAHCGLFVWTLLEVRLAPTETAHDAVITVILIYMLLHSALATLLTAMQAWRVGYGYVSKFAPYEPVVVEQLWFYTAAAFWAGFLAIVLAPLLWGAA